MGSVVEPIAVPKSDGCSQSSKRAKKWPSLIQHQCSTSQNLSDGTLVVTSLAPLPGRSGGVDALASKR
jgi:hypothetical protein